MTMRWLDDEPEDAGAGQERRAQSPPNTPSARDQRAGPRGAQHGSDDDAAHDRAPQLQWVSLGPSTTLFGQTTGRQAISGRGAADRSPSSRRKPAHGRRHVGRYS